jgi:signal transduction histidine kinase
MIGPASTPSRPPSPQQMNVLSELGFKSILDSLPCYITLQDSDFSILYANQTLVNDFGIVVGKTCHLLFKGSPTPCTTCPAIASFKDKQIHVTEDSLQMADGGVHQLITCTAPVLDLFGNVMAVVKISINATKVKEAHQELIFLGQSMALLSHDIKNILEGLQGGAYVVDEGIKDDDMKLARQGWRIVRKNIFEISRVAQNILFSSKKREPEFRVVHPGVVVRDVVKLFQDKAGSMGIQLVFEVNPALPQVKMDHVSILRMLSNLVWNGIEACGSDKNKMSYTVNIRSDYYDKEHYMFEVEDNGKGIDAAARENLFREFFTTKGSAGTGLGLIVVDRIVKQHKGRIDILTKEGVGSLFRVIFGLQ